MCLVSRTGVPNNLPGCAINFPVEWSCLTPLDAEPSLRLCPLALPVVEWVPHRGPLKTVRLVAAAGNLPRFPLRNEFHQIGKQNFGDCHGELVQCHLGLGLHQWREQDGFQLTHLVYRWRDDKAAHAFGEDEFEALEIGERAGKQIEVLGKASSVPGLPCEISLGEERKVELQVERADESDPRPG